MAQELSNREKWIKRRFYLEKRIRKRQRRGPRVIRKWRVFAFLLQVFTLLLKLFGVYQKGFQKAVDIKIYEYELPFEKLPEKFEQYSILHLTDLHLDTVKGQENYIIEKIKNLNIDICFITGDYRRDTKGHFSQVIEPLKKVVEAINSKDGIIAVLGNHDTYLLVKPMEEMGIRVLTNESCEIKRDDNKITISGVDDVHYYFTKKAISTLEEKIDGFKIALVHSPELFDVAAENSYSLYLCGHTHAGQICLPGGKPIIKHLSNGNKYYKGLWKYLGMTGYTGQGTGTSGIPVRYNSESEITLFRLTKKI